MRKWLYDRPWIWIVILLTLLVLSGFAVVVIAEVNKPLIVKEKSPRASLVVPVEESPANYLARA